METQALYAPFKEHVYVCSMHVATLSVYIYVLLLRANGARAARAGATQLSMSGLPADFDPLSPSMDHLSLIDEASKGRSQPSVSVLVVVLPLVIVPYVIRQVIHTCLAWLL